MPAGSRSAVLPCSNRDRRRFSRETRYQARVARSCALVADMASVAVSRQWGKGAVINRSSSRASWASLLNKSLFGRWPRWPSILTGLPPTVWVAAAAFASCCRIHWRQQRRLATIEAAEGSSRDAAAAVHSCDVLLWVSVTSPSFP
jgi:hypothetical protein